MKIKEKIESHQRRWEQLLKHAHLQKSQQFYLGDQMIEALAAAEQQALDNPKIRYWGRQKDLWEKAETITRHPVESLRQYVRVARVFPPSERIYDLSWCIYHVLAGVDDAETRLRLAAQADAEEWSSAKVREEVRKLKEGWKPTTICKISLAIPDATYSKLENVASVQGMTVPEVLSQRLKGQILQLAETFRRI